MNINRATVILGFAADTVVLHTDDKPSPMPNVTQTPLDVMFYSGKDMGEEYVKMNFPNIPIKVIPRI